MMDNATTSGTTASPEHPDPEIYYHTFDSLTRNGRVLTSDLSSTEVKVSELHDNEIEERRAYAVTLNQIYRVYGNTTPRPLVRSQEDMLQQRIVAPKLVSSGKVSTRSRMNEARLHGRLYPLSISAWKSFSSGVAAFRANNQDHDALMHFPDYPYFFTSLIQAIENEPKKEIYEQSTLIQDLRRTLQRSGLLKIVEESGGFGVTDFNLLKGAVANSNGVATPAEISVICESKSTHNLLLPILATEIVNKYNNSAHPTVVFSEQQSRTVEWSHIGHPLAQLLGYLSDNKRRFGVLTSGTRSYFVQISGQQEQSTVQISDAWFVGQPNYLRAWAYINSLGCNQDDFWTPPTAWLTTSKDSPTPQKEHDEERNEKRAGKSRMGDTKRTSSTQGKLQSPSTEKRHKGENTSAATMIPKVSLDEIHVLGVLGTGRNGATFKVCWNGQEVAMKQFDVGRQGTVSFEKEVEAYTRLYKVWGVLVPRPVFVSTSLTGGVEFLGLQLGRDPTHHDDTSSVSDILKRLNKEFGIKHNDAEGRNFIFVPDGDGSERLVAIDFEDWDQVG